MSWSGSRRAKQLVDQWHGVYDGLYWVDVRTGAPTELGEDFGGWNSSYTGEPIPLRQMREWRSAAVDRILALQPRRVLEIGVGSGLLLAHVAPECDEYWGTDFSAPTIQTLQAAVAGQSWGDRVRLRVQPADVADGLPQGHFDVVVLNSVVQYFPSAGYLLDVLAVAMRLLAPGGALFIGDVRNHSLQGAFQHRGRVARTTADATLPSDPRAGSARQCLASRNCCGPGVLHSWAARPPVGGRAAHSAQSGWVRQRTEPLPLRRDRSIRPPHRCDLWPTAPSLGVAPNCGGLARAAAPSLTTSGRPPSASPGSPAPG